MAKSISKSIVFDENEFEYTYNSGVVDLRNIPHNKKNSKFDILIITEPMKHEYNEKLILFQNLSSVEIIEKLEELEMNFLSKMFILDLQIYAQIQKAIYKKNVNQYDRLFRNIYSSFIDFEIEFNEQKIEISKPREEEYKDEIIIDGIVF